jgi:hypothetical protein
MEKQEIVDLYVKECNLIKMVWENSGNDYDYTYDMIIECCKKFFTYEDSNVIEMFVNTKIDFGDSMDWFNFLDFIQHVKINEVLDRFMFDNHCKNILSKPKLKKIKNMSLANMLYLQNKYKTFRKQLIECYEYKYTDSAFSEALHHNYKDVITYIYSYKLASPWYLVECVKQNKMDEFDEMFRKVLYDRISILDVIFSYCLHVAITEEVKKKNTQS